jgi:hypothetical protein
MATNKATRSDPAFTTAVAGLQLTLAAWRKERKHREPIPEPLWRDMVRVARSYRPSPVAQALRVNYTALKRRVLAHPMAPMTRTGIEASVQGRITPHGNNSARHLV